MWGLPLGMTRRSENTTTYGPISRSKSPGKYVPESISLAQGNDVVSQVFYISANHRSVFAQMRFFDWLEMMNICRDVVPFHIKDIQKLLITIYYLKGPAILQISHFLDVCARKRQGRRN